MQRREPTRRFATIVVDALAAEPIRCTPRYQQGVAHQDIVGAAESSGPLRTAAASRSDDPPFCDKCTVQERRSALLRYDRPCACL